jgi:hypothetical protein
MLAPILVFCTLLVAAFTAVVELAGGSVVIAVAGSVLLLNVLTVVLGASLKPRPPARDQAHRQARRATALSQS